MPAPAPVLAQGVAWLVSGWPLSPACPGPVSLPMKDPGGHTIEESLSPGTHPLSVLICQHSWLDTLPS